MKCEVCGNYTAVNWGSSSVVLCATHVAMADDLIKLELNNCVNTTTEVQSFRFRFFSLLFSCLFFSTVIFGIYYLVIINLSELVFGRVVELVSMAALGVVVGVFFFQPTLPLLLIASFSFSYSLLLTYIFSKNLALSVSFQRILRCTVSLILGFLVCILGIKGIGEIDEIKLTLWSFISISPVLLCIGLLVGL